MDAKYRYYVALVWLPSTGQIVNMSSPDLAHRQDDILRGIAPKLMDHIQLLTNSKHVWHHFCTVTDAKQMVNSTAPLIDSWPRHRNVVSGNTTSLQAENKSSKGESWELLPNPRTFNLYESVLRHAVISAYWPKSKSFSLILSMLKKSGSHGSAMPFELYNKLIVA